MDQKRISKIFIKIIPWFVPFFLFASFFVIAYKLNTKTNITRSKSISIFYAQRKVFEDKLAKLNKEPDSATFNSGIISKQNIPIFEIDYPATWSAIKNDVKKYEEPDYILGNLNECIQIYESIDSMPILEAKNYNRFMLEKPGTPYMTKENVETEINGLSAIVGKLLLDKKQPKKFIDYSLYVKNNKYSYIFHACPGTNEETFYKIYKSFRLIN